jgi:tight adherence protein C
MTFFPALLLGLAVAGLAWAITEVATAPRNIDPQLGRFEDDRRRAIRQVNRAYRWFEPWVDELTVGIERRDHRLDQFQRELVASGERAPWRPAEFLATRRIESVVVAATSAALGWIVGGVVYAVVLAAAGYWGYNWMSRRSVKRNALRRRIQLKRRFAAAIDLMSLMMEVGGAFQESLEVAAAESAGHPLGDELNSVLRDLKMGKIRKDALREFAARANDDDISEVVMALVEGEELGTPLAKILRIQADQMRQKRSQWAEKAAEESQVALVFPAMLIMLACLMTVVAPFILAAINDPGGF